MSDRIMGGAVVGASVLQVGLHIAGLPGWACPFKAVLGIPCPGCGLTNAVDLLLHGEWLPAIREHAFAPLLVVCILLILSSLLLPRQVRERVTRVVEKVERRTAISVWMLSGFMLYWGFRLLSAA